MSDLDLALCNVGLGSRSSPPPGAPDTAWGRLRDWQQVGMELIMIYMLSHKSFRVSLTFNLLSCSWTFFITRTPFCLSTYKKLEIRKKIIFLSTSSPRYRSALYWVKFVLLDPVATFAICQHRVWRRTELFFWVPLFSMSIILGLSGLWNRYWRTRMAILIYNKFRS